MAGYYIDLGDSMSIDLYPGLDHAARQGPEAVPVEGLGAASLFHRNRAEYWPEFEGRELVTLVPGIEHRSLSADGATVGHTRDRQLPAVPSAVRAAARVVTVTAGGNDLLGGLFEPRRGLARAADRTVAAYEDLVDRVMEAFPVALVILTTVYDPTDGTGFLPGLADDLGALPMEHLATVNDRIRELARSTDRAVLADVHDHFLDHGLTAAPEERWFWDPNPIEPGERGASEIRRLWLDAIPSDWI
jgi:lysophospholipase L1-like esterase